MAALNFGGSVVYFGWGRGRYYSSWQLLQNDPVVDWQLDRQIDVDCQGRKGEKPGRIFGGFVVVFGKRIGRKIMIDGSH